MVFEENVKNTVGGDIIKLEVLEKARTKRELLNNIIGRQLRFIRHVLREGIEKRIAEGEIT